MGEQEGASPQGALRCGTVRRLSARPAGIVITQRRPSEPAGAAVGLRNQQPAASGAVRATERGGYMMASSHWSAGASTTMHTSSATNSRLMTM